MLGMFFPKKKHVQHMLLRRSIWLKNTEQSQEITKLNVSALQVLPSQPTNIHASSHLSPHWLVHLQHA